jgi:hypothetical protein
MLLSIFTAAELQVICLIFSAMLAQERCTRWLGGIAALASALKEPELDRLLAPIASEIQ